MINLHTVIDFGSKNLKIGVFNQSSEIIYSSNIKTTQVLDSEYLDNSLNIAFDIFKNDNFNKLRQIDLRIKNQIITND